MGKSTVAKMFREAGVPVHDADAAVHSLYAGRAAPLIENAFPGTVFKGTVDRGRLGSCVLDNPPALKILEAIVHPLVVASREEFLDKLRLSNPPIVVFDIPLLFETASEKAVDVIVVVSASAEIQKERVVARTGMLLERLQKILKYQMPDAEKRKRADHIIDTGVSLMHTREQVDRLIDLYRVGGTRIEDA